MEEQKELQQTRKVYVVLFTLDARANNAFSMETAFDYVPLKVFANKLEAKLYCDNQARNWARIAKFSSASINWLNEDVLVCDLKNHFNARRWEIHETEIDDKITLDFHYIPIEKENEALRNECLNLRKMLSELTQRNAVAATYATMWDGGRDYTKESVLRNLQTVKDVLAGDHEKIRELYEAWKKGEEFWK